MKGHKSWIYQIIKLKDSTIILSCSNDATIKIWDYSVKHSNCIKTLSGHEGAIHCIVEFDESKIISGGIDNTIKIWDLISLNCIQTIKAHKGFVNGLIRLNDTKTIFSVSNDKNVKAWVFQ
jgi:WD40 repeat protein